MTAYLCHASGAAYLARESSETPRASTWPIIPFRMLLLAYDTTSEHGGVAIFRDHQCLVSLKNPGDANAYSIALFQMADRALKLASRKLGDVELFAVATGPGSFTGIRVGLAATLAWSKAFSRPACGVSVLEAMVEAARPETDWAVPIMDARRGEFYLGLFRRAGGEPAADPSTQKGCSANDRERAFLAASGGMVMKPGALEAFLKRSFAAGTPVTCVLREKDAGAQSLLEQLPDCFRRQNTSNYLVPAIACLAHEAYCQGRLKDPAPLDAYYIRRPDAELNWQEREKD